VPLSIPAAYQVATPFGVDVGGANPAFFASTPEAEYDSWLTVGATDGSAAGQIATVGLDFASWTETAGLAATDAAGGAVFWMLPDDGPSGSAVLAQLTVAAGTSATATMGLQGRRSGASANDDLTDWQQSLSFDVSGGAAPPPTPPTPTPPTPTPTAEYATASVDSVGSLDGYDTYVLTATLTAAAQNVYSIFGNADFAFSIPAAYQADTPFGANTGGVNPELFAINANSEFDSYLTIGLTDGDSAGALSSIGLDFASWTESAGLATDNGAVFFMAPDDGPSSSAVVAQLTIPAGTSATAVMGLQGRPAGHTIDDDVDDWQQSLSFDVSGAPAPTPTPTPTSGPTSMVVVSTDGVAGMTTYQLLLTPPDSMANVYAMIGNAATPLTLPPAFQVAAPFGTDAGAVNAAFFAVMPACEFDSWIAIGDVAPTTTPGFSMASWTATTGFEETDGGAFLMDPDSGPSTGYEFVPSSDPVVPGTWEPLAAPLEPIVMGQLTVETGTSPTATALLQGRPVDAAADDPQVPVAWSL